MALRLSKKKRPRREEKTLKEKSKIESRVFDQSTLLVLSNLIRKKVIKSLDYPIATGKEADVYRATTPDDTYLTVKIYRIETTYFFRMRDYIVGDQRFKHIKHIPRQLIYAWAQKEFKNLNICEEASVPSPKAYLFDKNILLMEFIGEDGVPDSTLHEIGSENPEKDCDLILSYIQKLYKNNFVHSDLSEFNILMHRDVPYVIDVGQGVLLGHSKAEEFLERDVRNILHYFKRYGVEKDFDKVLEWIKK